MKRIRKSILLMLLLTGLLFTGYAQKKQDKGQSTLTMTWTTKSKTAQELAYKGADYFMNIEQPQAYQTFMEALKLDPDFTEPLVFMVFLTKGEVSKEYAKRALKSATHKTEGEKLFASLVQEGMNQEKRSEIWGQLHQMFPDGAMIGTYYVFTRATPEERFTAAQDYIKKFPKNGWMYNSLAYYYMNDRKDMESAKTNFEKYIELYPDGYNPYDSMGEYYMNAGDMANAKKYYTMALEKYPFNNSSILALQKITDSEKKQVSNQ